MIGRGGLMETLEYNVDISPKAYNKSLTSLRNKIWKLLPIYEGRDRDGFIAVSSEQAYNNYCKNLQRLVLQVTGAEKIWFENPYYTELTCLLTGLEKNSSIDKHDELKDIITHCTALCEKMKVGE